jgi:hypothetical protein
MESDPEPQKYDPGFELDFYSSPYHPSNLEEVLIEQGGYSCIFSLYKGLPFSSAECQEWVKSRTGEGIKMDEYFQSQMGEYEPFSSMSTQSHGGTWELPSRVELDHSLEVLTSMGILKVFPVIESGNLSDTIDPLYADTARADTRACGYALIAFVAGFTEDPTLRTKLEASNEKLQPLIPGIILQRPTIAGLKTMVIMVRPLWDTKRASNHGY